MKISRRKLAQAVVERLLVAKDKKHVVRELAAFLIENKMEKQADLLMNDIASELEIQSGRADVEVRSAFSLSPENRKEIIDLVRDLLGAKSVELEETQDLSLLGGFVLKTPQYEYDASIRRQLNQLSLQGESK